MKAATEEGHQKVLHSATPSVTESALGMTLDIQTPHEDMNVDINKCLEMRIGK